MDLSPVAAAISDEGIEAAGKAIALGVGAGLGSIVAGIGIGIIFGKEIRGRGFLHLYLRPDRLLPLGR